MQLTNYHDRLAGSPTCLQHRQQVQSDLRITTQTDILIVHRSDHLGYHIDATLIDIPWRMGVIGTDVMLLCMTIAEHAAWLKEELTNSDIGRQFARPYITQVVKLLVITKHPFNKWVKKPFLQITATLRPPE